MSGWRRSALVATWAGAALALGSAGWTLYAQDRPKLVDRPDFEAADRPATSVQDALNRPCDLPFDEPTSLEAVAEHLAGWLKAPVVIDEAALKRLGQSREAEVRLKLAGVRLKTALPLVLDQVGMTYRVVPEDNLLILTDPAGADDPIERVRDEIAELHRDVHDLRDAVEDIYQMLAPEVVVEGEPMIQAPTIIEEKPPAAGAPGEPSTHSRPG